MSIEKLTLGDLPTGFLSPTQVNMYQRCPAQYFFRYIRGLKIPPGGSLCGGIATHAALETDGKHYIEKQEHYKTKDVVEIFADAFQKTKEEKEYDWKKESPAEVKDKLTLSINEYHKEIGITLEPIEVEKRYNIKFSNVQYSLVVVIDHIEKNLDLIDFKTKKARTLPVRPPLQLLLYKYAYPKARRIREDVMLRAKHPNKITKKRHYKQIWTPKEEQVRAAAKIMNQISLAIKAGLFYPNPGFNEMNCNMCGFINNCKKEWKI